MTDKPSYKLPLPGTRIPRRAAALYLSSIVAIFTASTPGLAQEIKPADKSAASSATADESVSLGEFVVSGVRASLVSAQEIKQNSPQFIDSIVAQDIGKFPDNTVSDALQRVPGIQVARANGEVSSVVIRGLPDFATTVNGHEIFTGVGRGVALQDVAAELIGSVDVYKTNSPDQIEGGIAGLIDIRLRKPLDFKGFTAAAGGRGVYNDVTHKGSYNASALVSNAWDTGNGGQVGALFSVSYARRRYQDTTYFNFLFEPVDSSITPGQPKIDLPLTEGSLVSPGDRQRTNYTFSLQWRPTSELELYSDTLYTSYRNTHDVHFFIGFPRFGAFQSASLYPGTGAPSRLVSTNNFQLTSTQAFKDKTDSYQTVFGAKWHHDDLKASTEFVYNWSSVKNRVVIVDTQFTAPATFTFDFPTRNVSISGADVTDGNNFALWGLFDNHGYQTSKQGAWKADLDYAMKQGLLTNIQGGVRVTDRDARSRQTTRNDVAPAAGRGIVRTSSIPGFGSDTPNAKGYFNSPHWFGGNPDFLRDHVDVVRAAFGAPLGDPNFDPAVAFTDKEKTYAAYGQVNYKVGLGSMPLDGLAGVRVVKTKEGLVGNLTDGTPVNGSNNDTQVMPMISGKLQLQDNLLLRASAGRVVTRPNFVDLNPAVSLTQGTTTGGSSTLGNGSGGNPALSIVKSNNYDLALEYYLNKSSYVSVAGFYRKINGYVQRFPAYETIGGTQYLITRPRNSGKGHLDGVELAYQTFFDFLPDPFKGFGLQANMTYLEGSHDVADTSLNAAVGARVTQPYAQVAKYSYNLVGIYEHGPLSLRLAYNWRGKYVDTFEGPNAAGNPLRIISVKPRGSLDFSAGYDIRKGLTITFDITNLTNSKYEDYFGPNSTLYPRDIRYYDRTYELGVRYRF